MSRAIYTYNNNNNNNFFLRKRTLFIFQKSYIHTF